MKPTAYLVFALIPFLASCEKDLDFDYHDAEPQLVIEAGLTAEGASVSLTRTTPMDSPMDLTPLTDASVSLTDLTAGEVRPLPLREDGSFGDAAPGIPGHRYRLDVDFEGSHYSSESRMRGAVAIRGLEFNWIDMAGEYVAVLQVSFLDLPEKDDNCYWIRLLRNGEPYQWTVIDSHHASDGVINSVIMTSPRDTEDADESVILRDGDVVTALVLPVSRDMLDYLMALEQDSNGPRMWCGDFCLGYFLAAPVSRQSIVYRPAEIEEYK